jgi:hypothetical protein
MRNRKYLLLYGVIALVISVPFAVLHLFARPDDAPISPLQHVVAALANYFGPWGVAIVRLVDFPNAGLRSFSWSLAAGLTVLGVLLIVSRTKIQNRPGKITLSLLWTLFVVVWFGVGLTQIADGLL